jgi:hypothetical protein
MGGIGREQRFTRRNPCPICDGGADDEQQHCWGYLREDGRYAFCTRDEPAGNLTRDTAKGAYKHLLGGVCRCGEEHGAAIERPASSITPIPPSTSRTHRKFPPIATHVYTRADGSVRFRVARFWSKATPSPAHLLVAKCMPQRPDGEGDWYDGLGGSGEGYNGLYHLPALIAADPWEPVWVVEGEKCADALIERGQLATTNAGGAEKWRNTPADHLEALRGRHVIILADNDAAGRAHADQVAASLASIAASVRIVLLRGLADKGDVYDWLADGHTTDELRRLAADTQVLLLGSHEARNHAQRGQDDTMGNAQKTSSDYDALKTENDRLREALRIAETSLAAARKQLAWTGRVMALPKEKLSPALKPAAIAVYSALKEPRLRDEHDMEQVYRGRIASACGVSDGTAGGYLRELHKAGVIIKDTKRLTFDRSETRITEGPLFDTVEAIPAKQSTWGGKRTIPICPDCGSENIEVTCHECGTRFEASKIKHRQVKDETPLDGPQEPTQDDTTPPYLIVDDLAHDGPHAADGNAAPSEPTPADADPDAEYVGADAIPACQDAKHRKAITALWAYQQSHDGEAPNEKEWREASGYGSMANAVVAFSHLSAAIVQAGLVAEDACHRFTLTRQPSVKGARI